jgi:hypothetical protein
MEFQPALWCAENTPYEIAQPLVLRRGMRLHARRRMANYPNNDQSILRGFQDQIGISASALVR